MLQLTQYSRQALLGVYCALAISLSGCGAKFSPTASFTPIAPPPAPPKPSSRFKKPDHVRGIYLTAWSAGSKRKMAKMIELIKATQLNSVVIDIRDAGTVYFKTGIKFADESGATRQAVAKPEELMDLLAKEGIYPIARIACFRDDFLPKKHPELAVQTLSGKIWEDRAGYMWLDPYNEKNWDYLSEVVDYALKLGFAEIQLDYVRFPSEGKVSGRVFPAQKTYPDPKATPTDVVAAFANRIGKEVKAQGAVFSADIFGIVSSGQSDQGIGQALEKIAEPFDVICPMVYPSHFARGEYGIKDPESSPHEILIKSLADFRRRVPGKHVRPWLQDFSLRVHYGDAQVKAQIKASLELGYNEFLLWNSQNRYTASAIKELPTVKELPVGMPASMKSNPASASHAAAQKKREKNSAKLPARKKKHLALPGGAE
jgi:hypothetical protein